MNDYFSVTKVCRPAFYYLGQTKGMYMNLKSKKLWVLGTVVAVGLTYAIVGSNAFADNTTTPTPVVSTTPTTGTTPTPLVSPMPILPLSPLATMPSASSGDDDGDIDGAVEIGDQSDDQSQLGDDEDGVSNDLSIAPSTSDENGNDEQSGDNQDDSGSDD